MKHSIRNQHITLSVNTRGAELQSLVRNCDGKELLWQGDPTYWEGQSPVLFPTIGNLNDATLRHQGRRYPMPKHGLVRGMDFVLTQQDESSLTLSVSSNEDTLQHFPFPFRLNVKYELADRNLNVTFETENPSERELPFQLGAHPAFNLPDWDETNDIHGYLGFDLRHQLVSNGLKPGGLLWPEGSFPVPLDEHDTLALTNHTFDCDTLLDSSSHTHACILYNRYRERLLTLRFNSPVLALWAPHGGRAPFVCIEPWWGCCDRFDYEGEFSQRPWTNIVPAHETRTIGYSIEIEKS